MKVSRAEIMEFLSHLCDDGEESNNGGEHNGIDSWLNFLRSVQDPNNTEVLMFFGGTQYSGL